MSPNPLWDSSCAATLWLTTMQICMINISCTLQCFSAPQRLHHFISSFHPLLSQVVPHVVHLVQSLRTDGLLNSKAFLLQFTELIHCMMYQYSGFPDLYDHILEAIKVKCRRPHARKLFLIVVFVYFTRSAICIRVKNQTN